MFFILSHLAHFVLRVLNFLTGNNLPRIVSVCVIIRNETGEYLVQDRSDGRGYSFPGGLSKTGEHLDDAIRRETREETGYEIQNLKFAFNHDASHRFKYVFLVVYAAEVSGGSARDSWEGKVLWMREESLKGKMAFDQEDLLEIYQKLNNI